MQNSQLMKKENLEFMNKKYFNDSLERRKKCLNVKKWLEKQLPPPAKGGITVDWNNVDKSLEMRVREVSIQLIESNPNTRVARGTIINALKKDEIIRINSYLHYLPKTEHALNECAETKEQYQVRHLPALVHQLRTYYNYREVTLDTIMSYRKSYRGISEEMKEILTEKLKDLN